MAGEDAYRVAKCAKSSVFARSEVRWVHSQMMCASPHDGLPRLLVMCGVRDCSILSVPPEFPQVPYYRLAIPEVRS